MIRWKLAQKMWNSKIINCETDMFVPVVVVARELASWLIAQFKPNSEIFSSQFAVSCQIISPSVQFSVIVSNATFETGNPLIDLSPCKWTVISGAKSTFYRPQHETESNGSRSAFGPLHMGGHVEANADLKNLVSLKFTKDLVPKACSYVLLVTSTQQNGYKRKVTLQNQMQTLYKHVEWMLCDMSARSRFASESQ